VCKKLIIGLKRLRRRVAKFIQLEELHEFCNQVRVDNGVNKGEGKEKMGAQQPFTKPRENR